MDTPVSLSGERGEQPYVRRLWVAAAATALDFLRRENPPLDRRELSVLLIKRRPVLGGLINEYERAA